MGSVVSEDPMGLRVKELFETVESFKKAASFAVDASKLRQIDTIYDLACGHGLLGALLAYRFPQKRVVCVDLQRRHSFGVLLSAFRQHGEIADGEEAVLGNLTFVEGDLIDTLVRADPESL